MLYAHNDHHHHVPAPRRGMISSSLFFRLKVGPPATSERTESTMFVNQELALGGATWECEVGERPIGVKDGAS